MSGGRDEDELPAPPGVGATNDERRERLRWERALPALDGEWTHWWLEGDSALLAVLGSDDIASALEVIAKHHARGREIFAWRAKVDSFGEVVREERQRRWMIVRRR
jgi:hypothetical protein